METLTWISGPFKQGGKFMKQIQELMTQGHADEQSLDYAVTQMSKDVEGFGAHAPTQKFQASEGCSVSLNTAPCVRQPQRSICLKLPTKC